MNEAERVKTEALEDAFAAVASAAGGGYGGFRHLKLRAMDDPQTREEIAELFDKVAALAALLDAEGYYDRPHVREQRRAVVVLDADGIDTVTSYVGEGVDDEYRSRFSKVNDIFGGGLSPVEYAVLPRILPFMGDHREQATRIVS